MSTITTKPPSPTSSPNLTELEQLLSQTQSSPSSQQLRARLRQVIDRVKMQQAETDAFFWATQCTQTIDEQDPENPFKPFPQYEYVRAYMQAIENIPTFEVPILMVPKSRSVMASWSTAAKFGHMCMTRPAFTVVIQSKDEERSIKLIEYARTLYTRSISAWREKHPLVKALHQQTQDMIEWANHSWMKAITGTPDKVRSEHPTAVVFDEGAFMPYFEECINVAQGAKPRYMVAISSANPGHMFDLLDDAKPTDWPFGRLAA